MTITPKPLPLSSSEKQDPRDLRSFSSGVMRRAVSWGEIMFFQEAGWTGKTVLLRLALYAKG